MDMKLLGVIGIYLTLVFLTGTSDTAYTYTAAKSLYTALTYDLNRLLRPSDVVAVNISFNALSINYLDVKTQTFSVTGLMSVAWQDPQVHWTPGSYSDIQHFFLTQDYFWRPELIVDNAVANVAVIEDEELLIRANFDGSMLWEPPGVFETYCNVDITYYPFDTQTCYISISSWTYDSSILEISAASDTVLFNGFEENAEWSVESSDILTGSKRDVRGTYSRLRIRFKFNLRRKTTYYVMSLLVPLILMAFLGHIVFLLPPESGEKISFSLTVLLAFIVLLTILSTTIPSTSETTSLLGIYVAANLVVSGLEVLITVFVLRCHHKYDKDIPVSNMVQQFTKIYLVRLSCSWSSSKKQNGDLNMDSQPTEESPAKTRFPLMPKSARVSPTVENGFHNVGRPKSSSTMSTLSRDMTLPEIETRDYTWLDISEMLDRVFLFVFLFISMVLTIVFMALICSN